METAISILKWLFSETIYGIVAVAAVIYGIAWIIKRIVPKAPHPAAVAVLVGVVGLFTVPSIPRYLFEQEVLAQIEASPWVRVTNQYKSGDLIEPLTLIKAPVGSVTMVMPNDPITGGFREVVMRYDEEPTVAMVDPDCDHSTIHYSKPDDEGVFRYLTEAAQAMTEREHEIYCAYDWTREKEALRTEFLRRRTTEQQ